MHLITKREGAFHPDRGGAFSYQSKYDMCVLYTQLILTSAAASRRRLAPWASEPERR